MCGYQSANSFCIAFKQATGMSPKQYREQTRTVPEPSETKIIKLAVGH